MTDMALARVHPDDPTPGPGRPSRPRRPGPRTMVEAPAPVAGDGLLDDDLADDDLVDDDLVIDPTGPTEVALAEVIDLHEDDPSLAPAVPEGRAPAAREGPAPARRDGQAPEGPPEEGHPPARTKPAGPRTHHRPRTGRRPTSGPGAKHTPPVIRLGLVWTLVLVVAIVLSPSLVAIALAPIAAIAAQSAWRRLETPSTDPWWLAGACAGVAPLAAVAGPVAAVLVLVAGGAALALVTAREAERAEQLRVALCSVAPAAAAASLVLATRQSVTIGLVLFMAVTLFDASNYVMGVGDTGGRLGALAGALSLAVLGVVLAGVLVVPFSGASPWVLCGMVAVAAPVAVGAGNQLVGSARLPAWRRLDSLFIAGPLWVLLAAVLLHP